jgi:hypothetical protein
MMQRGESPIRQLVMLLLLVAPVSCAPTVEVGGVYFPGWLVSATAGVSVSYGIVLLLARNPATRSLADSGLFFLALVVIISLAVWRTVFGGF